MGLPLILALRGETASGPIVTTLLVDIVIIQSPALALSEQGRGKGLLPQLKGTVRRAVGNPLPWAIVLGALWEATGLTLAGPVDSLLEILAGAATPAALFTIGAVLARRRTAPTVGSDAAADRGTSIPADGGATTAEVPSARPPLLSTDVWWLTALKLFAQPLLVLGLGAAAIALDLPMSEADLRILILVAALPSAANAAMLAERLGANSARIAVVILQSTVVGRFTFTALASVL